MSTVGIDDTPHSHLGCTVEQSSRDDTVGLGYTAELTRHGENAIVHPRHNLAHTSTDASLITEIGDILAGLADDDASLLGRDDRAQGQLSLSIFLFGTRGSVAVGPAGMIVRIRSAIGVRDVASFLDVLRGGVVGRHCF